jgi:hypothetical protein
MRNHTPLAPSQPAFDVTVHMVLNDFGLLGRAYKPMRYVFDDGGFVSCGRVPR